MRATLKQGSPPVRDIPGAVRISGARARGGWVLCGDGVGVLEVWCRVCVMCEVVEYFSNTRSHLSEQHELRCGWMSTVTACRPASSLPLQASPSHNTKCLIMIALFLLLLLGFSSIHLARQLFLLIQV